jgi:hypothetical protein
MTRSGARSAGGSERAIVSTLMTKSQVTMAIGISVQTISILRLPSTWGGSSPSGRARNRTSEYAIATVTPTPMTAHTMSVVEKRLAIDAANGELGANGDSLVAGISRVMRDR